MLDAFDDEMESRDLSGTLVIGDSTYGNPDLYYVIGKHVTRGGVYARKIRERPVLIVSDIDLGSAQGGRVNDIRSMGEFKHQQLMAKYGPIEGKTRFFHKVLEDLGFDGKIGLYGCTAVSEALELADQLRKRGHKIVGDPRPHLIERLRETKDEHEIAKIRRVAKCTEKVVRQTLDHLQEFKSQSGVLCDDGGKVTVSKVKQRIRQLLLDNDLESPEGTIFAVGKESADPHHAGNPATPIRVGVPIVFDIFPQQETAYWFDTTRTYCIGKPSKRLQAIYDVVFEAQRAALDSLKASVPAQEVADLVCEVFEKRGHRTYRYYTKKKISIMREGYIHSLGHGVGLTIGEPPYLRSHIPDLLKENNVTTVEPGLYYPELGGVRLEDTVLITKSGISNFSTLEKELVL